MLDTYVSIGPETTGIELKDHIIEIGAIRGTGRDYRRIFYIL